VRFVWKPGWVKRIKERRKSRWQIYKGKDDMTKIYNNKGCKSAVELYHLPEVDFETGKKG